MIAHGDLTNHASIEPGQLVQVHEVRPKGLAGTRMWQIRYRSTSSADQQIVTSGALFAPADARAGRCPVLGYAGGAHGLGGFWAPSELLRRGMDPEVGWIARALAHGFAVAVADGLTDGPHTFTAGRSAAYSLLDVVRVAEHTLDAASPGGPTALWGYGSGGRAAVWAAELAPTYAGELDLRGVVAGGVPADLYQVMRNIDSGPCAAFGFAALLGLGQAHPHLGLTDALLNRHGHEIAAHAHSLGVAELLTNYDTPIGTWCHRPDPWEHPLLQEVLASERAGRRAPLIPVHLYHGTADEIVPVEVARDLAIGYTAMDVEVTWREWPDTAHLGTGENAADYAVSRLVECLSRPVSMTSPTSDPVLP